MNRRIPSIGRALCFSSPLHGRPVAILFRRGLTVGRSQSRLSTGKRNRTRPILVSGQSPCFFQRRTYFEGMVTFLSANVHPIFFPPALFVALLLTLWVQKCIMMIIFQNKIIYMPGLPPDSRQEKLKDYQSACRPIVWTEETIRSIDGKRLALCVGQIERQASQGDTRRQILVLYFQG